MVDQNLLIIFVGLTTLAVLIQTGILVGLYFASTKVSQQADKAMDMARNLMGPVQNAVTNVQSVSARMAEIGEKMPGQLRQFENWLRRTAA